MQVKITFWELLTEWKNARDPPAFEGQLEGNGPTKSSKKRKQGKHKSGGLEGNWPEFKRGGG